MKLVSVIPTMNPASGGPAQGIRNNIPFWESSGFEITVVCLDNPESEFVDGKKIIGLGPSNNSWSYTNKLLPWLLDNLLNFDFIIVHGLWQYHGYAVMRTLNILKNRGKTIPKVFVMTHGMLDPYFQKAKERRWKAIRNKIYWHVIEKHLINHTDCILFTCQEELELAKTTFSGYKPKAVHNIGYGILVPPVFDIKQKQAFEYLCPNSTDKNYLLFISRIHPKKGADLLINAYKEILNLCDNLDMPFLVIAGPGLDSDYGRMLLKLVNENEQLRARIFFTGMLTGDAKWGAFYGCDAFILPSHQENFGIVVAEALACAKPVLITDKVNIWREISDGNCGIVNSDDLDGTIRSLKAWLSMSEQERVKFKNNALAVFYSEFIAEATSKKFIEILLKFNTK